MANPPSHHWMHRGKLLMWPKYSTTKPGRENTVAEIVARMTSDLRIRLCLDKLFLILWFGTLNAERKLCYSCLNRVAFGWDTFVVVFPTSASIKRLSKYREVTHKCCATYHIISHHMTSSSISKDVFNSQSSYGIDFGNHI